MAELAYNLRNQLARQVEHWKQAFARLADLELLASPQAWQSLEHYVGMALRQTLHTAIQRLQKHADDLDAKLRVATSDVQMSHVRSQMLSLRGAYLRMETTLDFFADALATRANPKTAAMLRACDYIATRSMTEALTPLGRQVPAALTYLDKGLGASILKAGLRLWDGAVDNPVAAIKVVRHNMPSPSIIHESGHQVAHLLGWNAELTAAFRSELADVGPAMANLFAGWATEIAADAFAFVHTGYASVVNMHNVLDGHDTAVYQYLPGDPHPISYLRLLIGTAACHRSYEAGPWDELEAAWIANHPIDQAPSDIQALMRASLPVLPKIVEITLYTPYRAFGGRALAQLINPQRVSPASLEELAREAQRAAFTSSFWLWNEAIRLLALTGYRAGLGAQETRQALADQEVFMLRLGTLRRAA